MEADADKITAPGKASAELAPLIAREVRCRREQVEAALRLFEDHGTVPFIARYRREVTGNLDEVQLRAIDERRGYFKALAERRQVILRLLAEQGKLTPELEARLLAVTERAVLEDLYLPFRPKRKTRASTALEKGLEPLARVLLEQPDGVDPEIEAQKFVAPEKDIATVLEALEGAGHIFAEWVAEDATVRQELRSRMLKKGKLTVRSKKHDAEGKPVPSKYETYYDFSEAVASIPSHRTLAIRRGEKEDALLSSIAVDEAEFINWLLSYYVKDPRSLWTPYLQAILADSYQRLLNAQIQTEIRDILKERADTQAIRVFQANLRDLLLAAPAGPIGVAGIDPGFRTGCKIAVIGENGKLLETATIHPTEPDKNETEAAAILAGLVERHNVRAIAIGNGTASRETDDFVRKFLAEHQLGTIVAIVVSESGASVYSASPLARDELPGLDVRLRGAVSIARRLQDPLAELVKIDPRSIGVGQYQHDVGGKQLRKSLAETVESCVNHVGVDLNTASPTLLSHVAGLNERAAKALVTARGERGAFRSRAELREVPGIGEKTFEQAAGFLRIRGGDQPLDATAVHPERYPLVERMAQSLDIQVCELIANTERIKSLDFSAFAAESGTYTLELIRDELLAPGRDPRATFVTAQFRDDIKSIADLVEGMELEGAVTNVAAFGVFVDIGVHQDGLVHASEVSHRGVRDPHRSAKVGQVVRVKVVSVDRERKRIGLSLKALEPPPPAAKRPPKKARTTQEDAKSVAAATEAGTRRPPRPKRPARKPGQNTSSPGPALLADGVQTDRIDATTPSDELSTRPPTPRPERSVRPHAPRPDRAARPAEPGRDRGKPSRDRGKPVSPGRPRIDRGRPTDGKARDAKPRDGEPMRMTSGPPPKPEPSRSQHELSLEEKIQLLKSKFHTTK